MLIDGDAPRQPSSAAKAPIPAQVTDKYLRAALPKVKSYKIAVGESLYLEVRPNGSKVWRWKYRIDGKENRFAIGVYPKISLSDARIAMGKARKLVEAGIHPSHQKKADRITKGIDCANTFEAIAEEWMASKDWEAHTKERRKGMFRLHVFKSIGKLPVKQITSAQILAILTEIAKSAPTVAADARRRMSGVFELAVATLRASADPVYPVRKAIKPNKTQHRRPLSEKEIGELLMAFDEHHGGFQAGAAFKLIWLTLCRPNEVIEAQWQNLI